MLANSAGAVGTFASCSSRRPAEQGDYNGVA